MLTIIVTISDPLEHCSLKNLKEYISHSKIFSFKHITTAIAPSYYEIIKQKQNLKL